MDDWIPEGSVVLSKIEIVEYLDAETGDYLTAERYWSSDGGTIPLIKKVGLLEQAKIAACIPMIQSAPDMMEDRDD